ncbi:MAG: exodeoxyribonuclease III [Butyrivibrio sp.]|nr:exodeoxyribonuclease III [Butyrivibrio sp.]
MSTKLISWNVNGLRACVSKGNFYPFIEREQPDAICLQETKLQAGQIALALPAGYHEYWNYAEKKGYSGTAIFTRREPEAVSLGIGIEEHDHEGRVITLTYPEYHLVTVYTPNAKRDLSRLTYRCRWEDDFLHYIRALEQTRPVIFCGDLNVAHLEIDVKNAKSNHGNAGFTDEERAKFDQVLDAGLIDTYRHLYPDKEGAYTWWSYIGHARTNNVGWRIDYFVTSGILATKIEDAVIYDDILGSDHCPVGLLLDI